MKRYQAILITLFFFACGEKKAVQQMETPELQLIVPENYITAGSNISVQTVNPMVKDPSTKEWTKGWTGKVDLWIDNGISIHKEILEINNTYDEFDLSGDLFKTAGLHEFSLRLGTEIIARAVLLVKASTIVDPIEVFSGPSTVWLDNRQEVMVVGIARDSFGNLARENDSVFFKSKYPSNQTIQSVEYIEDRMVFKVLDSGHQKGPIKTGLGVSGVGSKEQLSDAVALWPSQLEISISEVVPFADGRSFFKVQTQKILDVKGRQVADGTFVEFVLDFANATTKYQSYTIDGLATCFIRNPSVPGKGLIYATSVGNQSLSKAVLFESNVKEVNYKIADNHIEIGPVSSYIGQYLPDGTKVILELNGSQWQTELENGKARFDLDFKQGMVLKISDYKLELDGE